MKGSKVKVFVIQGKFGGGHGWEDLFEGGDEVEARRMLHEYRLGMLGSYRIISRRVSLIGNENMARKERTEKKKLSSLVPDSLSRHWTESDSQGMVALSAFRWRLRGTQKKSYDEIREIFIDRGIVVDEGEFETLMYELEHYDAALAR